MHEAINMVLVVSSCTCRQRQECQWQECLPSLVSQSKSARASADTTNPFREAMELVSLMTEIHIVVQSKSTVVLTKALTSTSVPEAVPFY